MASEERNYLRQWREFRGMTQEELAEAVGTNKAVISLLENEKRPLSSKWLRKFGEVLKARPGHILDFDPYDVGNDEIEAWANIDIKDRPQALRVLRSFAKTGTDNK